MKKMIFRITLFLFLSISISGSVKGQWWNSYGPGTLYETIETANGDLVAAGSFTNSVIDQSEGLILRTDEDGNELWRLTFPSPNFGSSITNIDETTEGDLLFIHNQLAIDRTRRASVYKISGNGNIIWEKPINNLDSAQISSFFEVPITGEILITGEKKEEPLFPDSTTTHIVLLD